MIKVDSKQNLYGCFCATGDKSLTLRAIILGAVAKGKTVINNPLIAKDSLSAIECVKQLGAKVEIKQNQIIINGADKLQNNILLDCGNSATLARLLIGLLSGANISATIIGDSSLTKRPMQRVCEPLVLRGAKIEHTNGCLPVKIFPAKLDDFNYKMAGKSAQVKGAILLSGILSGATTLLEEQFSTRDHTEKILPLFGINVSVKEGKISVEKGKLSGCEIDIPNDPSACAYFTAIGLLLGEVTVKGVLIGACRDGFYTKLKSAGAIIEYNNVVNTPLGAVADITAKKSEIEYFEVLESQTPSMIDELPLICAVACLNNGCTIFGAEELKLKESDRFSAIIDLIEKSGGKCKAKGGNLTVLPITGKKMAFDYQSQDHRLIMTAFVLQTALLGGRIMGEEWVDISFPKFFECFNYLPLGLIGENVSKSLSGKIHKFILSSFGSENFYYECRSLNQKEFDKFIQKPSYKAFNATIPYKEQLFLQAKNGSKKAQQSKSCNFVFGSQGYSTDGDGFILSLKYHGLLNAGKRVLLYGIGGAGKSVAFALKDSGYTVFIKNRTQQKAVEFCKHNEGFFLYNGESCDMLVNATSAKSEEIFTEQMLANNPVVVDINYGKNQELEKWANKYKLRSFNGEAMLFFQAYLSDMILLGKKPNEDEAFALYQNYRNYYEN